MSLDRRSDLNNAILMFITDCHANGDVSSLQKLGLDQETIKMIRGMTVSEALRVSRIRSPIAQIQIDNELLSRLMSHAKREESQLDTIDALILKGAPLKLMRDLYGFSPMEFSSKRKSLNVGTLGRTQDPTPEEEMKIYEVWKEFDMRSQLEPREWIKFAQRTRYPIRLIYKIICEQEEASHG